MKKRLFLSIGLFAFCVILSFFSFFYIASTTNQISNKISSIQKNVSEQNYDAAYSTMQDLNVLWKKSHPVLEIFIHHEALENIDQSFAVMGQSLENSAFEDFWAESARVTSQIENLHDSENISVGNIL